MTTSKSLPARPSLESLRKQAKQLARAIAAGDAAAIARARVHLSNVVLPLTQRNAQLVIAREYGYAGWQDLSAEVSKRVGRGLEWAVAQARRVIHDNDVERLKQLLAEYPGLLSWHDDKDDGGLLGFATASYGDSFDPVSEQHFTRAKCGDLTAFVRVFQREPWLLGEACVEFQAYIIAAATLKDRREFITVLLDFDPAILRRQPPPPSQAVEFAFTYVRTHLVPVLTRIWPLPDDLPHAAGVGNLPRVKQWFDESGAPALGDVGHHYPCSPYMPKGRVEEYALQWGAQREQRVLDAAFAWSVMNSHFDVADDLLDHGADINTTWSSHEPASILHELVFHGNYEAMRFLIDSGIDMTIKDYRWNATAQGWARHAANDEQMAQWLEEAERQRGQGAR